MWIFKMPMSRLCWDMIKEVFLSSKSLSKNIFVAEAFYLTYLREIFWNFTLVCLCCYGNVHFYIFRELQYGGEERTWALQWENSVSSCGSPRLIFIFQMKLKYFYFWRVTRTFRNDECIGEHLVNDSNCYIDVITKRHLNM